MSRQEHRRAHEHQSREQAALPCSPGGFALADQAVHVVPDFISVAKAPIGPPLSRSWLRKEPPLHSLGVLPGSRADYVVLGDITPLVPGVDVQCEKRIEAPPIESPTETKSSGTLPWTKRQSGSFTPILFRRSPREEAILCNL